MLPQDIQSRLRPFSPFRITTSAGETYDVRHPDMIMIGFGSITVGIPPSPDSDFYERTALISLFHVVKIEPLEPAQTSGQG
jgi:hypothetical protein